MSNSEYAVFIEKGNEYRIKTNLEQNDLFKEQYREALLQLQDIVNSQPILSTNLGQKRGLDEQNNNIIIFDGERGQGKSSAMRTFVNILKDKTDIAQLLDDTHNVTQHYNFHVLKTIDPSNFEKHNSVLNTVVANMYVAVKEKWDTNQIGQGSVEQYRDIMTLFEKAYESLSLINTEKASEKFDYDNGIEKIARVHQSDTLADTLNELIEKYLAIICEGNHESARLVIPIDDLDTYIAKSYSLVDEIRKYLILPNVVIVLACKVEQLTRGAELHFQKELESYKGNETDSINECRDMAARYIDKVLPSGRRITLPSLASFEQASVKLSYGSNVDGRIVNELPDEQHSLSETFISLIARKTGIRYSKTEDNAHPIVPGTLREIVDLTVLLARMEDCLSNEGIMNSDIYKKNLMKFKEYLIFNYIETSRDSIVQKLGRQLSKVSPGLINKRLIYDLLPVIENKDKASIYGEDKEKIINTLKSLIRANEVSELWPLGDAQTLIGGLSFVYPGEDNEKLEFVLNSLLTFSAHELSIISDDVDLYGGKRSSLFKFYNNSLFGQQLSFDKNNESVLSKNIDTMINQTQSGPEHLSRTQFEINYATAITALQKSDVAKAFLRQEEGLSQAQAIALLSLVVYHEGDYGNSLVGRNFRQIGLNSGTKTTLSLEALFVNSLNLNGIKSRFKGREAIEFNDTIDYLLEDFEETLLSQSMKQIMLNQELLINYIENMKLTKDNYLRRSKVEYSSEYFSDFFSRTIDYSQQAEILPTIVIYGEREEDVYELLAEVLGICLSNRVTADKSPNNKQVLVVDTSLNNKIEMLNKIIKDCNTHPIIRTEAMITRLAEIKELLIQYEIRSGDWQTLEENIDRLTVMEKVLELSSENGEYRLTEEQQNKVKGLTKSIGTEAKEIRKRVTKEIATQNAQRGK